MSARQAVAYFVSQGWTTAQAAGIAANLQAESGFRVDAVGDGGQAYGIAQWHPPRQADFARAMGKDIRGSTLDEQLAFVQWELTNTEKRAGDALRGCVFASSAGATVSRLYERPRDTELEATKRAALAEKIAAEYALQPVNLERDPRADAPAATQPALPPKPTKEQRTMGPLAAFLPIIFQLFQARGTAAVERIAKAPPDVAARAFQAIGDKVQELSGIAVTDPASAAKAVAAVAADPGKVQQVEDVAAHYALVEMGGGIASAREEYAAINRDYDDDPVWRIAAKFLANPIHWVTAVFLFYVQQFIPPLAAKVAALDGAAAMGLIVIVFGVIAVISARWLGAYQQKKED